MALRRLRPAAHAAGAQPCLCCASPGWSDPRPAPRRGRSYAQHLGGITRQTTRVIRLRDNGKLVPVASDPSMESWLPLHLDVSRPLRKLRPLSEVGPGVQADDVLPV